MSNIPTEYASDDFGFTAVDNPNEQAAIPTEPPAEVANAMSELSSKLDTVIDMLSTHPKLTKEEVDERLLALEKMVMPLLVNLGKNPEKDYILWPNRKTQIDTFVEKVLKLTRG